jgi:hypothetical protein
MLENAKRPSEAGRAQERHLEKEIAQLAISAKLETGSLLQAKTLPHKQFLQVEKLLFRNQMTGLAIEKSDLQSQAGKLSMVLHDILINLARKETALNSSARRFMLCRRSSVTI